MNVNRTLRRFLIAATVVVLVAMSGIPDGRPVRAAEPQTAAKPQNPAKPQSPGEPQIGSASHIQPLRKGFEFPHGKTLHFEGEWRFWTAGVATVRIERTGSQEHISAEADSSGVVAMLYRVQDRFNSYFDPQTLCSQKLIKHTEEGSHRKERRSPTTITAARR